MKIDNFNLAKFLTENKLTRLGRLSETRNTVTKMLADLTFEDLEAAFATIPDFKYGVRLPNPDDTSTEVRAPWQLENWKNQTRKHYGDELPVTLDASSGRAVVTIDDPKFQQDKRTALGAKGSAMGSTNPVTGKRYSLDEETPHDTATDSSVKTEVDFSKYNTVEELMKEIETSTNEAAHKHKMERVKEAYESLEARAISLEEGEHAAYIAPTKIREMKTSAKKLRKMHETLSKVYEKKYAKMHKKKVEGEGMA
jgi:hypothetical protein